MKPKLLQQGAEAKIILNDNLIRRDPNLKEGLIKGNLVPFIIKDRISKSYRIPELDKSIRKRRTKSETKLLQKSSKLINVPLPLTPSNKSRDAKRAQIGKAQGRVGGNNFPYQIIMPFIKGKKLSEYLDKFSLKEQKQIMKSLGESIAKLHKNEIIHGDLTTSNMILVKDKIYFIDFGLGYISRKIEDKAVDLHLLKQALEAKHFKHWEELVKEVFTSYKNSKDSKIVFERLKAVEKRGRYKKH